MNLCIKIEISQQTIQITFSIILKFITLKYYYNCQRIDLTIQQLFDRFQNHFEKKKHRRNILRQWNSINLKNLFRISLEKNKRTIFNEMIL